MNPKDVVRDAQSTETYDASAKHKAGAKLVAHPGQGRQPGEILKKPSWIRVQARARPTTRFYEIKDILRKPTSWSRCARRPVLSRTSASVSARARRPS
jgi:lipoic acid synthetase